MNFFKRIFSNKEKRDNQKDKLANISTIGTHEYFDKRFQEDLLDESILDGSLKMIDSYFIDNKVERKNTKVINHPSNLDQVVNDGVGFHMYCKALNTEDSLTVAFLAMAFIEFMIKNLDFKLYKDNEPEFPLRSMTLKYDKNGSVLSLYPYEYALKVLNYEATFEDLYERINTNLNNMPTAQDVLDNIKNSLRKE